MGCLPEAFAKGLAETEWPGRGQVISLSGEVDAAVTFFLDGAHTAESTEVCTRWFIDASSNAASVSVVSSCASPSLVTSLMPSKQPERVLLFNCLKASLTTDFSHQRLHSITRGLR